MCSGTFVPTKQKWCDGVSTHRFCVCVFIFVCIQSYTKSARCILCFAQFQIISIVNHAIAIWSSFRSNCQLKLRSICFESNKENWYWSCVTVHSIHSRSKQILLTYHIVCKIDLRLHHHRILRNLIGSDVCTVSDAISLVNTFYHVLLQPDGSTLTHCISI